ncbi:SubName: Full=Uncharacterized protein {ECO:0000313/EMBL:CCA68322.1} [Serendipita indica DSM 11827]|uniref:Mitochondrial import inner membrane translocase subunit TIM16 n=1 Tax=Serendipita indica (strain DSM 11827) TaxID=1109443 RepID=G4TAJ2_SERID|nr:SubName: Full=Uncharacterized protein {ECO:0000313/EMBL:CCA68322.1} [Serendipita indica DSM 11827]CCA68322.1 hypothetical protein PIIN_02187 [Serendipita indica DSM 11827]
MIIGGRIFGKALYEAGRQAYKNAQHRPVLAAGGEAAGVQNATSMSLTDKLTREHKMTADEARMILNVGKDEGIEAMMKHFDHLVKANSPKPIPEGTSPAAAARLQQQHTSLYLLAKVVRARERLEAEMVAAAEEQLIGKEQASHTKDTPP